MFFWKFILILLIIKKYKKNYLFLIFFDLFNFNLTHTDTLLQDKPNYSVLYKLKKLSFYKNDEFYKNYNIINENIFFSFYKSLTLFISIIKYIYFSSYVQNKSNNYYSKYFFKNFLYFIISENTFIKMLNEYSFKNFFFLKKKNTQLYLYFKKFFKTLIFSTNGIINKQIENKKKCMKKLDKVSIINLKIFLKKIIDKKNTINNNIFIVFFYLRKLYNKLLKILDKEKFDKMFNLSFFFDLKKSYSLNKVKKKRFIKKKLKKRIIKIDNI